MPRRERPYGGPAIPIVYDPSWGGYTNLTAPQILAFQTFPQDLLIYAGLRRWLAEISGTVIGGIPLTTQDRDQAKISQLKQALDNKALKNTPVLFSDAQGNTQVIDAVAINAIYVGVVQFVQSTYETYAALKDGINAGTITARPQIDAAYAVIAPQSPSALSPSQV